MRGLPLTIGVAGLKRSGKDTVGRHFVSLGYEQRAFADPLKEMALAVDPVVTGCVGLDNPLEGPRQRRLSQVVEAIGWERAKEEHAEVRRFLERLGTHGVRDTFGDDAWVDLAFPVERKTVFTDVRFPNEVDAIKSRGRGVVIRVVRPGVVSSGSRVETALDDVDLPTVINDSTVEELWRRAENVVRRETQAPRITIGCAICGSYDHPPAGHRSDEQVFGA